MIHNLRLIIGQIMPPASGAIFLYFYDILNDPMKLFGFLLIVLQIAISGLKLKREWNKGKREEKEDQNEGLNEPQKE